ncbi:MAG: hypothetical protein RLZZ555_1358 [Pseudomonadota bacterium]|jgi:HemY protein
MRGVFWFLGLAAIAVALALLMGSNHANLTLFWHPWRIDVSFNLALFGLLLLFGLLYAALRALNLLRSLPQQAQRWRSHHVERSAQQAVLEALTQQHAGRYVRSQAAAQRALALLGQAASQPFPGRDQAQLLSLLLAAESAHQLSNHAERDRALGEALAGPAAILGNEARAALQLRAASWAIEQQDSAAAARWLAALPQGVSRRIHALRLRLRLARLEQDHSAALELVRLLAKHRAYSEQAARSLVRGLVLDLVRDAPDLAALQAAWSRLGPAERATPELALATLERCRDLLLAEEEGEALLAGRQGWLDAVLRSAWAGHESFDDGHRRRLLLCLESLLPRLDPDWLGRIEQAQQSRPADAGLLYLAGQAYLQRQLWGKAAALLGQASARLADPELARSCWRSLARLAEQRGDEEAARSAWKRAALL